MEDESLVKLSPLAVCADDRDAFAELVAVEREPMIRLAGLLVGSRAIAEEIVQDAFGAVGLRWAEIETPGAYLRVVVVNGCRQVRRRQRLEDRHLARIRSETTSSVVHLDQVIELRDALACLSADQRSVVVLRYYVDLADDEIADLLKCRPSTVRSLARRGLTKLRKELQ